MTEQTTTVPPPVTIAAGTEAMTFPTAAPDGRAFTAKESFQLRLQNPQWVKDASTPGTPAFADREALVLRMAEQDPMSGNAAAPAEPSAEALTPPERFVFQYGSAPPSTPEQQALDGALRGWLSHAGFDANGGTQLAERVAGLASQEWTAESIQAHAEKGREALRRAWGDRFEANVAALDRLLEDTDKAAPGLFDFLESAPFLLTDPMVAGTLLDRALRRYGST